GIIARQAKELGVEAKLFGGAATATPLFQRSAGDAARGFVAVYPLPVLAESDAPAVVEYRKKLDVVHPSGMPAGRPSEYDFLAYAAAKAVERALEQAGRDLDRDKLVAALETLQSFETGLLFPITW